MITCGPGYPPIGQPRGHFTFDWSKVYSCSIPNLMPQSMQTFHDITIMKAQTWGKGRGNTSSEKNHVRSILLESKISEKEEQLPWDFGNNLRVTEDLSSSVPLIGGDGFPIRGVWVAHNLQKLCPVNNIISVDGSTMILTSTLAKSFPMGSKIKFLNNWAKCYSPRCCSPLWKDLWK